MLQLEALKWQQEVVSIFSVSVQYSLFLKQGFAWLKAASQLIINVYHQGSLPS